MGHLEIQSEVLHILALVVWQPFGPEAPDGRWVWGLEKRPVVKNTSCSCRAL